MDDEQGAWCPEGHGEFRADLTACPECGAVLVEAVLDAHDDADDRDVADEPSLDLGPWARQLEVVGAVLAGAVLLLFLAGLASVLAIDRPAGTGFDLGDRRLDVLTGVASVPSAMLLVLGGLALLGARHGGRSAYRSRIGAGAIEVLVLLLAAVDVVHVLVRDDTELTFEVVGSELLQDLAVIVLVATVLWVLRPWAADEAVA